MTPEDLKWIMNQPKQQTECLKCSQCCARVLPMQPSKLEAAVKYILEHPEILEKMRAIREKVSSSFSCPFLDLTTKSDERCIIYNTPIKFKICSLFQCWGDGNNEAIHEWFLSSLSTEDDLVIMIDLLYMICGDPENKASLLMTCWPNCTAAHNSKIPQFHKGYNTPMWNFFLSIFIY